MSATLGKKRWLEIAVLQKNRIDLKHYFDTHSGHLPDRSLCDKLSTCCIDSRYEFYGFDKPSGAFGASSTRATTTVVVAPSGSNNGGGATAPKRTKKKPTKS